MGSDYSFEELELRWQERWKQERAFAAVDGDNRPKYYVLDMFPYPSGAGLHIGHPEGYTASDILTRYKLARGYNVLHPMGWDAFGLPSEQYAIQTGTDPRIKTGQNIDNFRRQICRLGYAIDWSREIDTTDPSYYRWTQWIFLQLFQAGLAHVDDCPVWWCPKLKTVLANEEIVDGRSERGSFPVERRPMRQWVLHITAYADRLLKGLEDLDWPDSTKRQQIAWIGRSEGADIEFPIANCRERVKVFTTRADTIVGVTYLVLAPEHPLIASITPPDREEAVADYQRQTAVKSDLDRTDLAREKTGIFTGSYAINPLTGKEIPIWIADYVLRSYGTGAVMAVPAHDQRDYEFATRFQLPIIPVVRPPDGAGELPFCDSGVLIHSGEFDGLPSDRAREAIVERLASNGSGRPMVNYRLRDWVFSRQRYWGEPIPIVWIDGEDYERVCHLANSPFQEFLPARPVTHGGRFALPLPSNQLPLPLPDVENYLPADDGESPLAHVKNWVNIDLDPQSGAIRPANGERPENGWIRGRRETNTMPQWAGSCWYHLRYLSPNFTTGPVDPVAEAYWGTPDFYIGGAEHAVLHLLYARFWHQFLHDIGAVRSAEPYPRLFHQGIILGEDGCKMSKSRNNVINPSEVIEKHGADALRLFEMFLGPLEAVKPWDTRAIGGVSRFLKKIWKWFLDDAGNLAPHFTEDGRDGPQTQRILHETIQKVGEDIETLHLHTAISQMMILFNHLVKLEKVSLETGRTFLQLLAPFAPHICEELWQRSGADGLIVHAPFPSYDVQKMCREEMKVIVQVNGRMRGEISVPTDLSEDEVIQLAECHPKVEIYLMANEIVKKIYVPGKVVNFVLR
jgi:leucyl-tRNA synthetase